MPVDVRSDGIGGLDQDGRGQIDVGCPCQYWKFGPVQSGEFERCLSRQMRGVDRLAVGDGGVELGGVS